jgi:Xaa-Pro aminopeptidase
MRPVLEKEAAQGKTPEARARAAQQLLELPRLQRELAQRQVAVNVEFARALRNAKTPAEAEAVRAAMAKSGQSVATEARQRVRWTRIGNSCAGGAGR